MQIVTAAVPESPASDQELLELHRYGDPEAFRVIYTRFEEMVFHLALRMSADPEEAADCTQEVFLRVHRSLHNFGGRSALKTWIFRVALNCCRSRLRKRARKRRVIVAGEPARMERFEDRARDPEARTLDRDLAARLKQRLADLKPHYREAVILRDLEDLTYGEIAQVLGVRVGTVRSRIARGREQLRLSLESSTESTP